MTEHYRIEPTSSPSEFANQINRVLARIASRLNNLPAVAGQAKATAPAPPLPDQISPPGVGGGTGVPPAGTVQLLGDVTGSFDSTVVDGIQTIPILKPTVDGTVATFVLGVPDIEWKALVSAAQFRLITLAFAASPYSAVLSSTQITLYMASSSAGADFIFNLPVATGSGNACIVKKMDANAHNIAVTPNGANTIDGVAAASNISVQFNVLRLIDSGAGAWSVW